MLFDIFLPQLCRTKLLWYIFELVYCMNSQCRIFVHDYAYLVMCQSSALLHNFFWCVVHCWLHNFSNKSVSHRISMCVVFCVKASLAILNFVPSASCLGPLLSLICTVMDFFNNIITFVLCTYSTSVYCIFNIMKFLMFLDYFMRDKCFHKNG